MKKIQSLKILKIKKTYFKKINKKIVILMMKYLQTNIFCVLIKSLNRWKNLTKNRN